MFRIYIKTVFASIILALLVTLLTSCANTTFKKPSFTSKTEKSNDKAAGKIIAQPKFRISKKTADAYSNALKHMSTKNYDTAILEMQKVAEMDQRISGPWVNIGMAYKELDDMPKAKAAFQKALIINAKNPYALNQLAILQREEGKFELAEKLYKQALSAYPDYQNAHLNLAILCDAYLRKIACAQEHYQEYLNLTGGQDKQVSAWMSQLEKQGS
ncbi:MAG: tetratricopeptide repeat protein [Gammaproteobacteria bacterium]